MRDTFIFYRSFYEAIKELPKKDQLEIYNAIANYSLNFEEPKLSGMAKIVWTLILPFLRNNNTRYENGKKGGRSKLKKNQDETKKEPKQNQDETKVKAYKDKDKDKDKDKKKKIKKKNLKLVTEDDIKVFSEKYNLTFDEVKIIYDKLLDYEVHTKGKPYLDRHRALHSWIKNEIGWKKAKGQLIGLTPWQKYFLDHWKECSYMSFSGYKRYVSSQVRDYIAQKKGLSGVEALEFDTSDYEEEITKDMRDAMGVK